MRGKKLVTLIGSICLILVLAALPFLAACEAPPEEAPPEEAPPEEAPPEEAPPEEITLKFSSWSAGPPSPFGIACEWGLKEVEKRTNGRVKFELYYLGTLVPGAEEIRGVGTGMADLAVAFSPMNRDTSLLAGVSTCPGVPTTVGDIVADSLVYALNLHEMGKSKEIQEAFAKDNVKLLWTMGGKPRCLLSAKIPFTKCEDFKGRKTRALGDEAEIVRHFGGAAVGLKSSEEYEGLSRGIVDFCVDIPVGSVCWNLHEVIDYWVPLVISFSSTTCVMNLDTWNSLPEDIQQVFKEVAAEYPAKYTQILVAEGEPAAEATFEEFGVEKLDWPPEEQAKLDAAALPLAEEWALEQEERGLPGKKLLNQWFEIWGKPLPFPEVGT